MAKTKKVTKAQTNKTFYVVFQWKKNNLLNLSNFCTTEKSCMDDFYEWGIDDVEYRDGIPFMLTFNISAEMLKELEVFKKFPQVKIDPSEESINALKLTVANLKKQIEGLSEVKVKKVKLPTN